MESKRLTPLNEIADPPDVIRVGSVRTFLDFLENRESDLEKITFYRGHSDWTYKLQPSIYRNNGLIQNESILFQELILKCPSDFPNDECTFQKLVKMQHYSLPTRLLDLTANPLTALYFACEGGNTKMAGQVVLLTIPKSEVKYYDSDTVSVISNLSRRPSSFQLPDKALSIKKFNEEVDIRYLLHEIKKEKPYFEPVIKREHLQSVVCVKPRLDNARIIRQEGAFLLFGMGNNKTECAEVPSRYLPPKIGKHRILVRGGDKNKILDQLKALGVTQATLFPEIDRVSQYIKEAYASPEEDH